MAMMTLVTDVRLREGMERKWDDVMSARMTAVKARPGWVGGQLLRVEKRAQAPRDRRHLALARRLGGVAPRSGSRGDAPAARPARRGTGRARVERGDRRRAERRRVAAIGRRPGHRSPAFLSARALLLRLEAFHGAARDRLGRSERLLVLPRAERERAE